MISSAEDESSISVADHYKGTPPLKSKKKKRMSHEVPSDFQVFNSLKIFLKMLKFIHSEKARKFCEIFPLLLTTVHKVKSKGKISQNFVAFLEYMNFTFIPVVSHSFWSYIIFSFFPLQYVKILVLL